MKKENKKENIIENTDYGGKQIKGDKIAPEILLRCEMCEYSFEIKITLKKHINRKQEVHNCDKRSAQLETSMKMLKHMVECPERGKKDKCYCDVCGFSCKTMKTPKSHE